MNALRTLFHASRAFRIYLAVLGGLLLAGLLTSASLAGKTPAPAHGLGAALSLIAQQRAAHAQVNAGMSGLRHAADGRALLDRGMMRPGAIRRASATSTNAIVPVSGGVQTFDIFNPPPAFRPLVGFGSSAALNNDPTNPPVFINNLTPTNMMPVWSQDEQFIIFSSNRTAMGDVQTNGRFHLWAISVNGGEAFQITDSVTGPGGAALPAGGGEFFPALSPSNNALAFTSDAQSPGAQNLYALQSNSAFAAGGFSFTILVGLNNSRSFVNVSDPTVITSLTIRSADATAVGGDPAASPQFTGFSTVRRPTFSPSEGQIVFTAFSVTGTNKNHFHLYFLNTNTRGFDANSASFPGKLTDGPADDTDPAYSPDGQFIAFASTASSIATQTNTNPANGPTNSLGPNPPSAVQPPDNSQTVTTGATALRSIFLLGGGGSGAGFGTVVTGGQPGNTTQLPGGRVSVAGTDNFGPAWSNFANPNQFTNPTGNLGYLAFSRSSAMTAPHDVVYLQVVQGVNTPNTQTLTPESTGNRVVTLNTDDNAGETSAAGNVYDDAYPSWSPFLSIFSITYSSNRTVTYNNPASGVPTEVAASIPDGGQAQNPDGSVSYTVAGGYQGVLVSQVLNLDPPTLLRFNADEVIHVQAPGPDPVRGTANKLAGAGANRTVTMTVRLSDREAGIDDTGGPNGGPRVYVQIKDPDSKYQDGQNQEHKVFAKDRRYDVTTGQNPQANHPSNDITSGTMNGLLDQYDPIPFNAPQSTVAAPISEYGFEGGSDFNQYLLNPSAAYTAFTTFPSAGFAQSKKYVYPTYGPKVGDIPVGYVLPRGVHGGMWPASADNPDNTYIFIGKSGGGTNPGLPTPNNTPAGVTFTIPGPDPRLFIPTGPEYETEVINPQFATSGNANAPADPTPLPSRFASTVANPGPTVGDFITPFWLAGVDDQGAFSGGVYSSNTGASNLPQFGTQTVANGVTQTDRPTANFTTGAGGNTTQHPAEWLQLQRVPAALQDNAGGVLYTVNFTAPATGSDFYVDVIAYDKAAFPNIPNVFQRVGFQNVTRQGTRSNWRIYDNVGGFSTNQNITNNDILVVSDYALGQKFAATTFGGQRGLLNLVPKLFGAEAYVTDVDVNLLPNAVYRHQVITGASPDNPSTIIQPLDREFSIAGRDFSSFGNGFSFGDVGNPVFNGLGVGSYYDQFIDDGGRIDNAPAVRSQQYSIWRTLARGPVPASVYRAYLPTFQSQPAVADTNGATKFSIAAAPRVPVANRCIVWVSPFTGDVLAGPGTLADTATQRDLRNFVLGDGTAANPGGGRLFISGQDVASTLTQNGQTNNAAGGFVFDVLNATLATPNGGTHIPAVLNNVTVGQNRITATANYDGYVNGNFPELNPGRSTTNIAPGQRLIRISNNFGGNIFSNANGDQYFHYEGNWRTDGSLDQLGPYIQPFPQGLTNSNSVLGAIDTITPGKNAQTDITLSPFTNPIPQINGLGNDAAASGPGGVGLIYTENPVTAAGGTGSKVVYASFGIEALSTEYYKQTISFKPNPIIYEPRNQRQGVLHNIVSYLRTGSIAGTIRSTSGNGVVGSGVTGVTVYLQSAYGPAIPGRGTFSARTDSAGNYRIDGIEPGNYTLVAYRTGFIRATSNPGVIFTVEGDSLQQASLTLVPASPGSISGKVTDTSNNLVAGASVVFTSTDGQIYSTTTDANGNYTLSSVAPSTYSGTATKTGFGSQTQNTLTVASNAPLVVNFTLQPGPGAVTGRVVDTAGNPISGAKVFFSSGSPATVAATATTDATGAYTIAALAAGTYNVTASATGFGSSAPISVVVVGATTTTVPDITLGAVANGTLGGLVTGTSSTTPVAGVTLTIVNTGTGLTVSPSPTTTGTATAASDGGQINYGPITLGQGTYTVTATKNGASAGTQTVTIAANTFSRLDFTGVSGLPPLHTFPAGLNFLSLPFDYSSSSFDSLFGALNTAPTGTTPNGNRSYVEVWNPLVGQYAHDPNPPADVPRLGVGYWVFLKNAVGLTQPGGATAGAISVALHPSWNQIGVPSTSPVPVANLSFDMGGGSVLSFANAAGSANHIVSPTLYRYDGSNYQAVSANDSLQPYQAYWIKVFVDTTVRIPTGR